MRTVNWTHDKYTQEAIEGLEKAVRETESLESSSKSLIKHFVETLKTSLEKSLEEKKKTIENLDAWITTTSDTTAISEGLAKKLNQLAPYASQSESTIYQKSLNYLRLVDATGRSGVVEYGEMPIFSSFEEVDILELLALYPAVGLGLMSMSMEETTDLFQQLRARLDKAYSPDIVKYHLMMALVGNTDLMKEEFGYLIQESPLPQWESELQKLSQEREVLLNNLESGAALDLEQIDKKFHEFSSELKGYLEGRKAKDLIYLTKMTVLIQMTPAGTISENINSYLQQEDLFAPLKEVIKGSPFECCNVLISLMKKPIQAAIVEGAKHVDKQAIVRILNGVLAQVSRASNEGSVNIGGMVEEEITYLLFNAISQALAPELGSFFGQMASHATPEEHSQIADFYLTAEGILQKKIETMRFSFDGALRDAEEVREFKEKVTGMIVEDEKILPSLVGLEQSLQSLGADHSDAMLDGIKEPISECLSKIRAVMPGESVDEDSVGAEPYDSQFLIFQLSYARASQQSLKFIAPITNAVIDAMAKSMGEKWDKARSGECASPHQALTVFSDLSISGDKLSTDNPSIDVEQSNAGSDEKDSSDENVKSEAMAL